MSQNRIDGAAHKAVGAIKEAVGKAVGNHELEAKGIAEKAMGTAENEVGKAQDRLGSGIRK